MTAIPAELFQAVAEAGDGPIRLVDPRTDRVYLLVPTTSDDDDPDDVSAMEDLIDDLDPEDWVDASRYDL